MVKWYKYHRSQKPKIIFGWQTKIFRLNEVEQNPTSNHLNKPQNK